MHWILYAAWLAASVLCQLGDQDAAANRPAFEVASIKPAPKPTAALLMSGELRMGTRIDPARVDIGSSALNSLIAEAYRVKLFQVSAPDWLGDARFAIQAKLPAGSSTGQVPEMLQTLLEDRFRLKFHKETREFAVYVLGVGSDGPKLESVPPGYDPAPTNNRRAFTLDAFAWFLYLAVDRPVLDETQLRGEYVIDMTDVVRDLLPNAMRRASSTSPGTAAEPTGGGPFHAVQALGLKLEPRKRNLTVIVVDSIEKMPTEN
jgi:uncharacterized protein (TIGR03435 family)